MERRKLRLLSIVLAAAVVAGCGSPQPEAPKPAEAGKLPPNMQFGYKPPK